MTLCLRGQLFSIKLCDDYILKEWLSAPGERYFGVGRDTFMSQQDSFISFEDIKVSFRERIYNCNYQKPCKQGGQEAVLRCWIEQIVHSGSSQLSQAGTSIRAWGHFKDTALGG